MAILNTGTFFDEYLHIGAAMDTLPVGTNYTRGAYITWLVSLALQAFGPSIIVVKLIPATIGILNILLVWQIARTVIKKPPYIALTVITYSAMPWVIFNHFYIRTYVMLEFAVLFTVWFGVLLFSSETVNRKLKYISFLSVPINFIYFFYTDDISRFIALIPLSIIVICFIFNKLQERSDRFNLQRIVGKYSSDRIKIILIYTIFAIACISLLSKQNIIPDLLGYKLAFSSSAFKYDDFFLLLNLLLTILFVISVIHLLVKTINSKSILLLISLFFFSIHSFAGYGLQMMRSIFYFQGLFIISAILGLITLKLKRSLNALIIIAIFLTILNNYPTQFGDLSIKTNGNYKRYLWFIEPYIHRELPYLDYFGVFKAAKESGMQIYAITALTLTHTSFYEVELAQSYVGRSIWVITGTLESVVEEYLANISNSVLVLDRQGYGWLCENELDHLVFEMVEPILFSGEIYLFIPENRIPLMQ